LISDNPLVEYSPLQRAPKGEGIVSQYCMEDVEAIGLLKLDVLGLSTLTVLDRAFHWIRCTNGIEFTQETIPMDDPDTYALLSSGEVTGIFQVESEGMRRILRDMQPTEFKEIVAVLALYRPGPMQFIPNYIDRKFGREPITYHHPSLEPILQETYGIIVYQEQIIQIATQLAGYTAGEADLMRRAVGKKKKKALEEQHTIFVEGAVRNGISPEAAEAIFADIELFADYGFNKSHSAAYAVITLQTAYLKAHYPAEFMAALLSVDRGNFDKVPAHIAECRRLGVEVRPPDVNRSAVDFTIEPSVCDAFPSEAALLGQSELSIRFGLGAIKNVGDGPAQILVDARGDRPFVDIDDLAERVDLRQINKRALECMVRAGAFDSLGERNAMLESLDKTLSVSQERHRAREVGQGSLFDMFAVSAGQSGSARLSLAAGVAPLPERKRLADEKELLGVYVSAHPLNALSQYVDERLLPIADLASSPDSEAVTLAGMVQSLRQITTKKGDPMAFAQLEDLSGAVELVIFPRTYEQAEAYLSDDSLVLVRGRIDMRDERAKIIAEEIEPYRVPAGARKRRPTTAREAAHLQLEIPLDSEDAQAAVLADKVVSLLTANKGSLPFSVRLVGRKGRVEMTFPDLATTYSPALEQQLVSLVGREHLTVRWA
jgi:DNA polymerase-3 subunit alpha